MTTYSIWNHGKRAYDYYEAPGAAPTGAPRPRHLKHRPLGLAPEQAAWPLPENARRVGSGREPRGYVASLGIVPDLTLSSLVVYGGIALALWWYLVKGEK